MTLYYNCDNPIGVLTSRQIHCSRIFTGVSLSEWSELFSHGPFKIAFKRSDAFVHCIKVQYWNIRDRPRGQRGGRRRPYYARRGVERVSKAEYDRRFEALFATYPDCINRIWKPADTFQDECEWFSPDPIAFSDDDVLWVMFMTNAPNPVIGPRKLKAIRSDLREMLAERYVERDVDDHRARRP